MAEFISKCPHCQSDLQLQDDYIGMVVECPVCSKSFCVRKNATPTPKKSTLGNGAPKRQHNQNNIGRVNDNEEDNFVLEYLERSKIVWKIIFILGCVALVIFAIGWCRNAFYYSEYFKEWRFNHEHEFWIGIGFLFSIIPWYGTYLFVKVILCWLRGIYRNTIK